ncbi:LIM/homeobox protein Awh-like isoform X1 [Daphnia pulex]|uniref:LIM/homeobox protein Awh-like isoform X1 n=1 Tax=Daphnia pulex TaxID=6669 RepID=UPI001EDFD5B3|nr:LIM/homeobox protein Awh-like isoform X1 [Daphnia pulex]
MKVRRRINHKDMFMDTSMSPASSLHPVSPCEIKREKTEAPSPSDCSIDSTSGMGGVGGIGSVGSNASLGLASGSSGQVGVAAGVCAACGELITDRFLIQVSGRTWHSTCLRCSVCRTALDNQPSCFVRAGAIYCRADYTRTFGAKCARCSRSISAADWVRRAREHVYHLACFACDACRRQLSTGEEFALHEGRVLCKTHYLDGLDAGSTSSDETDPEGGGRSKSKRVRTTFTEEQLHVLQANFLLDSNPDGQDLERIANLTGLSKRVTQVWFQNMRARHKKHLSTSTGSGGSGGGGHSNNNNINNTNHNNNNNNGAPVNKGGRRNNPGNGQQPVSMPPELENLNAGNGIKRMESSEQAGYSLHLLYSYTMQTPDSGESSSSDAVMRSVRGDL